MSRKYKGPFINNLIAFSISAKGKQNLSQVFLAHHISPSNVFFFLKTGPVCKQ